MYILLFIFLAFVLLGIYLFIRRLVFTRLSVYYILYIIVSTRLWHTYFNLLRLWRSHTKYNYKFIYFWINFAKSIDAISLSDNNRINSSNLFARNRIFTHTNSVDDFFSSFHFQSSGLHTCTWDCACIPIFVFTKIKATPNKIAIEYWLQAKSSSTS